MVTITNILHRTRKDGTSFIVLEITGSVELVQSQTTGRFYATVRKCNIPCTFDESIAERMIGQTVEGTIERVHVAPYEFLNKRTGEVLTLQHGYAYRPKGAVQTIGETRVHEMA